MRVAITTGHLAIPPTYFVTQHAERLAQDHQIEALPLAAHIRDSTVRVPIAPALSPRIPWSVARYLAPAAGPRQQALVRRFGPDVVHQHFATWATHALRGAQESRAPAIVTLHGYDVFEAANPRGGIVGALHSRSIADAKAKAGLTLAVSKHLAGLAVSGGWRAERLEVHYQGVETDFFSPEPTATAHTPEPVVAFVGALTRGKGVLDLVRASLDALPVRAHRLRIAGSGPLRPELEVAAEAHPHIELLGALDRTGVRTLLRGARVFALPAQEENGRREAAGLVLLEAQACGVPVLATASGGMPEMLQPDVTGLLVPEGDARALGGALADILRLPDAEWHRSSVAAREFVVRERSVLSGAQALLQHYENVSGL